MMWPHYVSLAISYAAFILAMLALLRSWRKNMHDETPAGIACKDRTLAYWTDQSNFTSHRAGSSGEVGVFESTPAQRFALWFVLGGLAAGWLGS